MRIGHGYDVHKLVPDRKLILGGVTIDHPVGLLGHSDADVLCHAISDALLGACALGDIGLHFPDSYEKYKNASSIRLLSSVCTMLDDSNFLIHNIDSTLVLQSPKVAPFVEKMKTNIALACHLHLDQVSVKATTTEKLGFAGREEGIAAYAVVLVEKKK